MPDILKLLAKARAAEKAQALFYRALAAEAEERGAAALAERFNDLHADEQHHLSRLSVRLMEMGAPLVELGEMKGELVGMDGWEPVARLREEAEVHRYEALLAEPLDPKTDALLREILDTERHHAEELGGKWTPA
ncbi:MAG TPA: ferritin family protein [Longimicrobium sp.]